MKQLVQVKFKQLAENTFLFTHFLKFFSTYNIQFLVPT